MEDYTISDHKHMLGTLVQQVRDLLVKAKNNDLKQYGITVRQLAVLDIISILGNKATPTEISVRLLRQPHSISSLLARMEKRGLVSRAVNPEMKKSVNISLTKKGKQLLKDSLETETVRDIVSCLPENELHQLIASLKELRNTAIDKLSRTNSPPFP